MIRKVFGIISYFPDNDTDYLKYLRKQRERRCSELLTQLGSLWADIDIIIIAQNWQSFTPPSIPNNILIYKYGRLGLSRAQITLRSIFLTSDYDYLILLDDDAVIQCEDPKRYIDEIDKHPDGVGVLRHENHPLMLMAISRAVYKEIDYPNINTENGEGLASVFFVEKCFNRFSGKAFNFPDGCITEVSYKHKYNCPSTWMSEATFDWTYMGYITEALLQAARHKRLPCGNDKSIDVVIPYVDSSDLKWQETYIKATGDIDVLSNRFRSWDTLKYLLRGVDKYMPFVRNVVLLVSDETQVPKWLNINNVRVVYHQEFIPAESLPIFNSCAIESYLFNITKLSEQFIYFNDDIFPINNMVASDFFVDGKPLLSFHEHTPYNSIKVFSCQCRSSLDVITGLLGVDTYDEGEIISPEHSAMPMLKSSIDKVGELGADMLRQSVTKTREDKNVNQYIYHYYQYFTGNYIDDFCPYIYTELQDDLTNVSKAVSQTEIPLICLNDLGNVTDYEKTKGALIHIFQEKFPSKSRYEI